MLLPASPKVQVQRGPQNPDGGPIMLIIWGPMGPHSNGAPKFYDNSALRGTVCTRAECPGTMSGGTFCTGGHPALRHRDCHSPGTECTNAQVLKELRPTRTCTSTSNSTAYVRDCLATYVASQAIARARFCELAAASIAGVALEWKFRASTSSTEYRPHLALTIINDLRLLCFNAVGTA